jgi:UDP-glucose 4-epimerase
MKALITGGSGFIGSHIVDQLLSNGFEVRIFDMVQSPWHKQNAEVEYYNGSLLSPDDLKMAMYDIQIVFHLAAVADVNDVFKDPYYAESINVRGTANVLEAVRGNKQIERVVYGSTTWVYSNANSSEVNEDTPLNAPNNFYTTTKLTAEYYCQSYSKMFGVPISIVRYGIPYGPRARDAGVIPVFVDKAIRGVPITIAGDGMQFRNFVYVEDLALGNVKALRTIAKNRIYNLDGTERITIKQIAQVVQKIIGNVEIEYIQARPGDFSGKNVCTKRAKEELDWEAGTPFEEGVRRYIDWYKQRKEKSDMESKALASKLDKLS